MKIINLVKSEFIKNYSIKRFLIIFIVLIVSFTESIKGIFAIIHWILLFILIIIAGINFSWIHVILIPLFSLITGWIISPILINTVFKR